MVNYQEGKIYKITSPQTNAVYIGSTTKNYLSQRFDGHRRHYRLYQDGLYHYVSSFEVLQFEDADIILIELFPCNSKDELRSREQYFITATENCVNLYSATSGMTRKEYEKSYREEHKEELKKSQKEYYENKKDEVLQKQRIYYENNKDKKLEYQKQYAQENRHKIMEYQKAYSEANSENLKQKKKDYYEKNKEMIQQKHKEYLEKNKESLMAKRSEKIQCSCGGKFIRSNKSQHEKTTKHKNWLSSKN